MREVDLCAESVGAVVRWEAVRLRRGGALVVEAGADCEILNGYKYSLPDGVLGWIGLVECRAEGITSKHAESWRELVHVFSTRPADLVVRIGILQWRDRERPITGFTVQLGHPVVALVDGNIGRRAPFCQS